tara:strand:- start:1337 stop:1525 length:189 start_codon:yes stop_codon:yes gene_type:complete
MFTKQHFIALAGLLKLGHGTVNADQMAGFFLMINPKFDKKRFLESVYTDTAPAASTEAFRVS